MDETEERSQESNEGPSPLVQMQSQAKKAQSANQAAQTEATTIDLCLRRGHRTPGQVKHRWSHPRRQVGCRWLQVCRLGVVEKEQEHRGLEQASSEWELKV